MSDAQKRITVLGSTGSVGVSTLDLIEKAGLEVEVEALVAGRNLERLAEQARRWRPEVVVTADEGGLAELRDRLAGTGIEVAAGEEAVLEAAARPVDWVMAAIVGSAGLKPTWAAARTGATLALANKESLVCCGPALLQAVAEAGGRVIPVDSEHSAIFQVLQESCADKVSRLVLTASGGPFRTWPYEKMVAVTPEQAVAHPNWSMGAKISVDSASMANKGLETIEAAYLFGMQPDQVDVVVHPQSIVHSLVEYADGSTLAQLGPPDMKTPIAVALAWPDRLPWPAPKLDLAQIGSLTFEAPDLHRFPMLRLAREALAAGGGAPAAFNAANEAGVAAFLDRRLGFLDIAAVVEETLDRFAARRNSDAETNDPSERALEIDREARRTAEEIALRRAVRTAATA